MVDQVRIITAALEEATERVISSIAINTTAELIERTPVDLGWARANWVPSIGAPYTGGATDNPADGAIAGATAAQSNGVASMFGYRLSRGAAFISNNVPYVTLLNQGSSDQAPAGFVQDAIKAGIRSLGNRIS